MSKKPGKKKATKKAAAKKVTKNAASGKKIAKTASKKGTNKPVAKPAASKPNAKQINKPAAKPAPKPNAAQLPLPEPKPPALPDGIDHTVPQEAVRHVLGPIGPVKDADEEARIQKAVAIEIRRLAAELGLQANVGSTYTAEEPQTQRANDIKQIAGPQMQKVADEITLSRTKLTATDDRGRSIEITKMEFKARNVLRESLGGVAKIVVAPFKFVVGVSVKVGKWIKVQAGGKVED